MELDKWDINKSDGAAWENFEKLALFFKEIRHFLEFSKQKSLQKFQQEGSFDWSWLFKGEPPPQSPTGYSTKSTRNLLVKQIYFRRQKRGKPQLWGQPAGTANNGAASSEFDRVQQVCATSAEQEHQEVRPAAVQQGRRRASWWWRRLRFGRWQEADGADGRGSPTREGPIGFIIYKKKRGVESNSEPSQGGG